MALSTTAKSGGKPIAVVVGGDDDGMVVYTTSAPKTSKTALTAAQKALIAASLKSDGYDPEASEPARLIERALAGETCTGIRAPAGGSFTLHPSETPERVYVAGPSGAGKSTITAMYVREWCEMHPDQPVYLFSTHDGEKAYEELPITQIALDEDFLEEPPGLDELKNSLTIFDDTDNLQDKNLQKAVQAVNNDLLANGRKYGISTITLNHQISDYSRTRTQLNEANRVVVFPSAGGSYHINRFLTVYAGFDKTQIKRFLDTNSRWACLGTTLPGYVITENEVYLVRG
jgi:hypothetical protein